MKRLLVILLISLELYAGSYMCGSGTVIKLLSDDSKGSRHQKFIIRESSVFSKKGSELNFKLLSYSIV